MFFIKTVFLLALYLFSGANCRHAEDYFDDTVNEYVNSTKPWWWRSVETTAYPENYFVANTKVVPQTSFYQHHSNRNNDNNMGLNSFLRNLNNIKKAAEEVVNDRSVQAAVRNGVNEGLRIANRVNVTEIAAQKFNNLNEGASILRSVFNELLNNSPRLTNLRDDTLEPYLRSIRDNLEQINQYQRVMQARASAQPLSFYPSYTAKPKTDDNILIKILLPKNAGNGRC